MNIIKLAAAMDSLLDKLAEEDDYEPSVDDQPYEPLIQKMKRTKLTPKRTLGSRMTAEDFNQVFGFEPTPNQLKAFRSKATQLDTSMKKLLERKYTYQKK